MITLLVASTYHSVLNVSVCMADSTSIKSFLVGTKKSIYHGYILQENFSTLHLKEESFEQYTKMTRVTQTITERRRASYYKWLLQSRLIRKDKLSRMRQTLCLQVDK